MFSTTSRAARLKAKLNDTTRAQLLQAMPSLKERAKTLLELIAGSYFIFADRPLEMEAKAEALLTDETRALITKLRAALEQVSPWSAETTEAAMRNFAEQNNLKLGAVAQPLRAALTGRTTSPGIFEVLAVLGARNASPGSAIKRREQAQRPPTCVHLAAHRAIRYPFPAAF
jgi:glutamyl-tRNA synthetase